MQVIHGATALAPPEFAGAAISKSYSSFIGTPICDIKFFSWLAKHPLMYAYYADASQGIVIEKMTFNQSRWLSYPIFLPSLAEQRTIAEILDATDEAIRTAEQLIAKLEQSKQGLLHNLFASGISSVRDHEQSAGRKSDLKLDEWQSGPAESFCEKITVGVVTGATRFYSTAGTPFIRSQNVHPNSIISDDMLYITDQFNRSQGKSILRAGDVVVVRTGYPGTAAVIPPELDGANCFSLIICRPKPVLDPHFFAGYMNSSIGRARIARTHFGSAQHNFNIAEMRRLPISVPPLGEQHKILEVVSHADARLVAETQSLHKLRLLKQGLMDDLLTGRVRVGASA